MGVMDSIERFAQEQGWVVKYAADGTPNFFYPIPKMKSSDIDPSLPNTTHPAFRINGQEVSRRLIAVYKGGDFNSGCHSIPNVPPLVNLGADQLLAKIKANGAGFGPKTVADSGLLLLLAKKLGYSVIKGNNNTGQDYCDATKWAKDTAYTVGNERAHLGILYECITAHTSVESVTPPDAPLLWKPIRRIGGVMAPNNLNTLTGSGPKSWRFGGKANGIDDLTGNTMDQDYGYRIVGGEIQIIADNNAADPGADLSANSAAWKAILPSSSDETYTLVAPGTAGTLHWNWLNDKWTLDTETAAAVLTQGGKSTAFKDLAVNSNNLPYVPCIMRELGLFPISGDQTQGTVYMDIISGERFPRRGGNYYHTSAAGLGCVYAHYARSDTHASCGVRSGFVE